MAMTRELVLEQAREIITVDREATHGKAENSFKTIARMWSAYLDVEIEEHDVCALMALMKLARIKNNAKHVDSWRDAIGYNAIGAELVGEDDG